MSLPPGPGQGCHPSEYSDVKGIRVLALGLPTSHAATRAITGDDFTAQMLDAINGMMLDMLDMLAAIAHKDCEQRRQRQAQGIAKASEAGKYQGRPIDSSGGRRRQGDGLEYSTAESYPYLGCACVHPLDDHAQPW